MMNDYPVDPVMVMQEATQSDLVRRKLDMDALRKRLGDTSTKQQKLRESCEGFEAIFLQKMWEQMRKTVPKEGYLHSKDEEMYQSLFDVELCKKMAGAGGIGLADMLYEQLSQQLENTGRTTTPSTYMRPMHIEGSDLLPASEPTAAELKAEETTALSAESLYSPLEQASEPSQREEQADEQPGQPDLAEAAENMGRAVREWAAERDQMAGTGQTAATGGITPSVATGSAIPTDPALAAVAASPAGQAAAPPAPAVPPVSPVSEEKTDVDPALLSRQGPGPVSAKPKPVHMFGRQNKTEKTAEIPEAEKPAQPRGMVPDETLWPLPGNSGDVVSRFGWEDDPTTGKRRWNSGISIAAQENSPVRAVLDGTVVYAGNRDGYGHSIVLEHSGGFRSYYSGLQEGPVKIGDKIAHGAEFAKIAAQPSSPTKGENSASLFFELKKGEMAINPESAIKRLTTANR